MSLFKLYNLRVGVGRKLGGDLWGQAASWGPLSIEGFLGPEAELPVFGNVQTEKGCSSRRDPALKRVFCTEWWLDGRLQWFLASTHIFSIIIIFAAPHSLRDFSSPTSD